jgi:hypothetical protein
LSLSQNSKEAVKVSFYNAGLVTDDCVRLVPELVGRTAIHPLCTSAEWIDHLLVATARLSCWRQTAKVLQDDEILLDLPRTLCSRDFLPGMPQMVLWPERKRLKKVDTFFSEQHRFY